MHEKSILQKFAHHKIFKKNHAFTKERIVIEENHVFFYFFNDRYIFEGCLPDFD